MSNNIKTKNLIYGFNKYVELPYQSSQMIDYSMNNKYPNAVQLNNTYGQCVDNDLFIAKNLINRINGTSEAGPRLITDESQLDSLPNGAKFFSSSGSSEVMQKHINSLQSSLLRKDESPFNTVKFTHKISSSVILVCTSTATYTMSSSDIDSTGKTKDSIEVKDSNRSSFVVTAVIQHGDMSSTFFAGHPSGTTKNGIYCLMTQGIARQNYSFQLLYEFGSTATSEICALACNDSASLLLFSTETKLYSCSIDSSNYISNVKQICMFDKALNGIICAIIASNNSATVFTSTGKIYSVPYAAQYIGFQNPSLKKIDVDEIVVHESQYANGIQYFATSNGLQVMSNGELQPVNENLSNDVKHIEVDSFGRVWCGDSEGNILVASNSSTEDIYDRLNGKCITDIKIIDGVKLVVTTTGLMYEKSHHNFLSVTGYENVLSTQFLIDNSLLPLSTAYMFTASGAQRDLSAITVKFYVASDPDDYNVIDGLSVLSSFGKNGYSSNVFKLIDFNNQQSAFINYVNTSDNTDLNYAVFNVNSHSLQFDDFGRNVNGIIRAGDDDLYIFTTDNMVQRLNASNGTIVNSSIYTPSELKDAVICDSLSIYQDHYFVTLSGSSFQIALVMLSGDDMQVLDTLEIGTKSDIVKYGDYALAFTKQASSSDPILSSFYASYKLNDFLGPQYYDDNLSDQVSTRYELYKSLSKLQVVNNLSYRVKNSWTYVRSDYIVPLSSSNVSAIQSFIEIEDNQGDPKITAKCMDVNELTGTGDVSYVECAYDISGNIGTSYISSNNAVYTFQVVSSLNKYMQPAQPFDDSNKIVHNSVSCAVIDALSVNKSYDAQQQLTSYVAQLCAYEIGIDGNLSAISCQQVSSINLTVDVASSLTAIDVGGSAPLMLCKSYAPYVLLSSGQDQYKIAHVAKNGSSYSITDISSFSYSGSQPNSFSFSYETDYGRILSSLPDDNTGLVTVSGDTFDECIAYVQNASYEYEVDHEISRTISAGTLNVLFDDARFFMRISCVNSAIEYSDLVSCQLNASDICCAVNANQTGNDIENAMLVFNGFISQENIPLLIKTGSDQPLHYISDKKLICGRNSPVQNVQSMGKDDVLEYALLRNVTAISAVPYDDPSNCITGNIPASAHDVHLVQCCDKLFNNSQFIAYQQTNGNMHEMYIKELSADANQSTLLATSSQQFSINILNSTSDCKFPLVSYASTVGTIDYENSSTFSLNVLKTLAMNVSSDIKGIALDVNDSSYVYVANKDSIYECLMLGQGSDIYETYNFINSLGCKLEQIAFIDSAFGGSTKAFANVVDSTTGVKKSVAINANRDCIELDTNQDLESLVLSSTIGMTLHDITFYRIYGCKENFGSFYLDFSGFGTINGAIENAQSLSTDDRAHNLLKLDNADTYAVQAESCVYKCVVQNLAVDVSCLHSTSGQIGALASYEDNTMQAYYMSQNENVLSSQDLSTWNIILSVGSSENAPRVTSLALLNPYSAFAAKTSGDDVGLYYTYYSYYTESNMSPFTAQSAYTAYYDNKQSLDQMNESCLNEHIQINHDTPNCDMDLINSCMSRSFQIPDGFMRYDNDDVVNDYIVSILTGDESSQNIIAYSKNTANGSKWTALKCNYIAKCWKSGLTELYIYLPTTNTYYIPHIEGAGMCGAYDEQVDVNDQRLTSNVRDNTTTIRVNIMSRYFTIDVLAENTVKVNSLPLRMFKDDQYSSSCAGSMFHSFVLPSVAEEFHSNVVDLGYYTLNYYCFGSDAQAIKLTFMNNSPNYEKKFKTITYHANGAEFKAFPGMKSFTQRIYEDDSPVQLYWSDILTNDGSFFTGWSRSSTAVEGDADFQNGVQVSYSSLKSMSIDLYACWVSYTFGSNDTTITIANTQPIDYTIAEITIDPNAPTPNNWQPGNKLIVDYGD